MASEFANHDGGYIAGAPVQNMATRLSNGTQPTDAPAGFTSWDVAGNVIATRPLTAEESTRLAAQDAARTALANQPTVQTAVQGALTQLQTIIGAQPITVGSLAQAQTAVTALQNAVQFMAQVERRLIRLALSQFDGTN